MKKITKWFKTEKNIRFNEEAFMHNNKMLMIITGFLFVEQILYAYFVNNEYELLKKIHLATAIISLFFLITSIYLHKTAKEKFKQRYNYLPYVAAFFYFTVAVLRVMYNEGEEPFVLSTFFIAILYGFSFLACIPPRNSIFLYFYSFILLLVSAHYMRPELYETNFIIDIFANTFLAFIASVVTYNRFVNQFRSNERIRKNNIELEKLSSIDMLTDLPNRRNIDIELINETKKVKKGVSNTFTIVMADIDYFKNVNDNYGHRVGDKVLKEFAEILKNNIRDKDMVGRWGGEEFVILLKDTEIDEGEKIIELLRKKIEEHDFDIVNNLTCSFGLCSYNSNINDPQKIVGCADKAMYRSKESGRNKVCAYKK